MPPSVPGDGHLAPLCDRTEMSDLGFKSRNRVYLSLLSLLTWPLTAQVPACILSGYNEGRSVRGSGGRGGAFLKV